MQRIDIEIDAFDYDDQNEAHLAKHGVTPGEIDSVLYKEPRFFTNLPGRSATHVMIGPGEGDRFYYVAIIPANQPRVWYPVTGWQMSRRRAERIYESR